MESTVGFEEAVESIFRQIDLGLAAASVCELALAECLVHPLRTGRMDLLVKYEELFLPSSPLHVVPVGRDVLRTAAEIRAAKTCHLADAIHIAAAISSGATAFVTADRRLLGLESLIPIEIITSSG